MRKVARAALHEVDEATGRGHAHVHAVAQFAQLAGVGDAAEHREDAMARGLGGRGEEVLDLLGQLARGRDDERRGRLLLAVGLHALQDGQAKRSGFAGAGLRGGHDIPAVQHERDGLLLDGRGLFVAKLLDGGQAAGGEAEFFERGHKAVSSFGRRLPRGAGRKGWCKSEARLRRLPGDGGCWCPSALTRADGLLARDSSSNKPCSMTPAAKRLCGGGKRSTRTTHNAARIWYHARRQMRARASARSA